MLKLTRLSFIFLFVALFNSAAFADPWFTGPLLAPAGHTIPNGHTNFELYGLDVLTNGRYNEFGVIDRSATNKSFVVNPIMTHGFTDWLDVQWVLPYVFNSNRGAHYDRLADMAIALGIQIFEQKGSSRSADVRILVQETFPTGSYEHLNPLNNGTDSTGLGSYQTQFGLNFQYLTLLPNEHYLRTRLIISRLYSSQVRVSGVNSYGGTVGTVGRIRPGSENGIDLAFEYTLTQNWVAVMEGSMSDGKATRFNGILNIGDLAGPGNIGSGLYREKSLAPAIEYNFNGNVGLIGGVWFPVSGKNTSHYMTYVLALNTYW